MPIAETLLQARALLEDIRLLGISELPAPAPEQEGVPLCPVGSVSGPGNICRPESLDDIRTNLGDCTRCPLHQSRTNIAFGVGNAAADILFIGEAPGRDEDLQGEPFVGEAGQLLNRIFFAMGLPRAQIYIANILKCRPPQNRNPGPEEILSCIPFLKRQITAIQPRVIITLGKVPLQALLERDDAISRLRGTWLDYEGIPLMPTFHPAYLLRTPEAKRLVWEDMKQVLHRLQADD